MMRKFWVNGKEKQSVERKSDKSKDLREEPTILQDSSM